MSKIGWYMVTLSAVLTALANLFLRVGVQRAGGFPTNVVVAILNVVKQPLFDIGVIFYALAALVWFRVLATESLSIAYPILVSITFMLVTVAAAMFFHETLNVFKLLGLTIILAGIYVISMS